jgi:peptide/histidine transporter 3/4
MYKELKELKEGKREVHTLDAPSFNDLDVENYMVVRSRDESISDETALLDSASIHTILRDPSFFNNECLKGPWQSCDIITIAGSQNFKFREGRATIILPGGFPLRIQRAMFAPAAPRSLISYRDLRANGIHLATSGASDEAALILTKDKHEIATIRAGPNGFYPVRIMADAPQCNMTMVPKA